HSLDEAHAHPESVHDIDLKHGGPRHVKPHEITPEGKRELESAHAHPEGVREADPSRDGPRSHSGSPAGSPVSRAGRTASKEREAAGIKGKFPGLHFGHHNLVNAGGSKQEPAVANTENKGGLVGGLIGDVLNGRKTEDGTPEV
ncbi:hypothetical protein HK101_006966, partial [Irineochytrium annulatum]